MTNNFSTIRLSNKFYYSMTQYELEHAHKFTHLLVDLTNDINESDYFMLWGLRDNSTEFIELAKSNNKPFYYFEDGFIRSIFTAWANVDPILKSGISFTVDSRSAYFDANKETDLEMLLNYADITENQIKRAKKVIQQIIINKVSKYNNQKLVTRRYGKQENKVLIIDQSYKDASIELGWGCENDFIQMVDDAIRDNPNSDILIKIHPDTIAKNEFSAYFAKLKVHDKVITIEDEINPIVLLEQVNKVYVCTSQFGFEALLCGKEVHVYGMPFYAGWGVTNDIQKCERRIRKRTVEEIFYIAYIMYTYYVNPKSGEICSIEDAISYIINLRYNFFLKENANKDYSNSTII